MGTTLETGASGEEAAARWLTDNGFTILHRNWRSGRYELDIVATKADTLHIVEVKCRKAGALTAPEDAATAAKFRSLQNAATAYIERFGIDLEVQFDLIAVEYFPGEQPVVRYIPDAMQAHW